VSLAGSSSREIKSPVTTAQIAPTILSELGLNPKKLEAVVNELTPILPGLDHTVKDVRPTSKTF
jgi:hypothetical protein